MRRMCWRWVSCVALAVLLLGALGTPVLAASITVAPYRMVLNAQGAAERVQVVVRIYLADAPESGEATLTIEGEQGTVVVTAGVEDMYYCFLDDNLLVDFDRDGLYEALAAAGINGAATATIKGWVEAEGVHTEFSGTDEVLILSPGKAGK